MPSRRRHLDFNELWKRIYDITGSGAWQTVHGMLRQFFIDIALKSEILATEISDFLKYE